MKSIKDLRANDLMSVLNLSRWIAVSYGRAFSKSHYNYSSALSSNNDL